MTTRIKISDLADAMIENYWLLCSPQQAIANALGDYAQMMEAKTLFWYNDEIVTPEMFITALSEMVVWFLENHSDWKA